MANMIFELFERPFFDVLLVFINIFTLIGFALFLFSSITRDVITEVYERQSWKCYITNIIAIISAGYLYFFRFYSLSGMVAYITTVTMFIYYIVYLISFIFFCSRIDDSKLGNTVVTNELTLAILLLIILFTIVIDIFADIICVNYRTDCSFFVQNG